jgi:hypothetical protein
VVEMAAAYRPGVPVATTAPTGLASYQHWTARAQRAWPPFQTRRLEHLAEGRRYGGAPEKVAEDIVADLLTDVLGWAVSDLNHQVKHCDILLAPPVTPWGSRGRDRGVSDRRSRTERKAT